MAIWSDIFGSLQTSFRLGLTGVRLKSGSGGRLEVRDNADAAASPIAASRVDVTGNAIVLNSETANTLTLQRNASQASPIAWTFPATAGTAGQVFGTDGAGNMTFQSLAGGGDKESVDTTTLAFGDTSPKAMFTLPANAVVNKIKVTIDTTYTGTPSMSVGTAASPSKYLASNQVDLKQPGTTIFEVYPGIFPAATTEALIVTYSAGAATAGSARIEVFYATPS